MTNRFPVGFWNFKSLRETTAEDIKIWAECGMTTPMSPGYSPRDDEDGSLKKHMLDLLDECLKYDMKFIIHDSRASWRNAAADEEGYRRRFTEAYEDFGKHPATYGFYVGDEPSRHQMPDVMAACRIQREVAPELAGLINFFPLWDGPYIGYKDVEECFEDYRQNLDVKMISYDRYSQMNPEDGGTEEYFRDLRKYYELAKSKDVPLWTVLLCIGHFRYRVPNRDDLRWQFTTSIASGCKGIMWFFFHTFKYQHVNYRGAPINMFGERTETYYYLSDVLREFHHNYGNLFETLKLQKSYHLGRAWGGFPLFKDGDSDILLHAETIHGIDGIISFFKDEEGTDYIAVVNNSKDKSGQIALMFPKSIGRLVRARIPGGAKDVLRNNYDEGLDDLGEKYQFYPWLAPGQLNLYKIEKEQETNA